MGDDELDDMVARDDMAAYERGGVSDWDFAVRDRAALLREVHRLRAELAGRRAGEDWLEAIRKRLGEYDAHEVFPITASAVGRIVAEVEGRDAILADLLNNEGRALREAGAAEERARVLAMLRGEARQYREGSFERAEFEILATYYERSNRLPDLLPPLEQRAALEASEAKVATLRAACERIVGADSLDFARITAFKALGATA